MSPARVETRRPTFEFAAFVDLLWGISQHLDRPTHIEVDLRRSHFFGPSGMVPLISLIDHFTIGGWDFDVFLPEDGRRDAYFDRAGWTAGIEGSAAPDMHAEQSFMPLQRFERYETLNEQINEIINVLSTVTEYEPGVLRAIEWTVNEIADNVLLRFGRGNRLAPDCWSIEQGLGRDSCRGAWPGDFEQHQGRLSLRVI